MADRPIIFSAPMVRALLVGGKTQERRLLKPPRNFVPEDDADHWSVSSAGLHGIDFICWPYDEAVVKRVLAPYAAGDRLYVREKHWAVERRGQGSIPHLIYDDEWEGGFPDEAAPLRPCGLNFGPHPSTHMHRWASRLTLLVDDVRVQRIQSITEEDAIDEGVCETDFWEAAEHKVLGGAPWSIERLAFADLWNSLHGKEGTDWDANPWVVALSFRVVPDNIDNLPLPDAKRIEDQVPL